jgi:lysophospholipase
VDDFSDYLDDLALVVDWARARNANLPWALLGHSMGGTIAAAFALEADNTKLPGRLVLAAPWLRLKMKVWAPKRMAANVVARMLPTLTGPNGLRGENISRDPRVQVGFNTDPLVHHVASAGWFMAMLRAQARIRERAKDLKVPTLLLLAGEDRIVSNDTTQAFARSAGNIVTSRTYDGLFHELFLEPEADVVLADIVHWLNDGSVQTTTA